MLHTSKCLSANIHIVQQSSVTKSGVASVILFLIRSELMYPEGIILNFDIYRQAPKIVPIITKATTT